MQKNIPSQVCMEHSSGQTTSWFTNQISVNLRKLMSNQAPFLFFFFTLQYFIDFAIHQHESAMGVH